MQEGFVEASTLSNATALLQQHNLVVVSIEPQKEAGILLPAFRGSGREFQRKGIRHFFAAVGGDGRGQSAAYLSALKSITEQTDNPYFARILSMVLADIDEGKSLSDCLKKHPEVFSELYVNMVQSGEVSGNLQKVS